MAFTLSENNVTLCHPKLTRKLGITLPILHFWTQLQKGSIRYLLKTAKSAKLEINTSGSAAPRPRAPPPPAPPPGRAAPTAARGPLHADRGRRARAGDAPGEGSRCPSLPEVSQKNMHRTDPSVLLKIGYKGVGLMMAPWFNLLQILSWKPPPTSTHTAKGGVSARRVEEGEKAEVHIFGDHNILRVRIPRDQERVGGGQAREHFKEAWARKKGGWGAPNAFPAFPSPTQAPAPQRAKLKNAGSTGAHPPAARRPRPPPPAPPARPAAAPTPGSGPQRLPGNGGLRRRSPLPGMEAQGNSPPRRRRRRLQPPPK